MHRSWQWVVDDCDVRIGVTTSRRDRTTSTLVVADGHALLVDPSWDPDELAGLAADVAAAGIEVALGFATHAHHDHLLWHPALGSAPRLASPAVARQCATDRDAIVAGLGPDWPAELADLVGRVDERPRRRRPGRRRPRRRRARRSGRDGAGLARTGGPAAHP